MRKSITSIQAPDTVRPMQKADYSNLCEEFGKGYDPRDKACVRCHLQLLCMSTNRANFYPQVVAEVKEALGVKYFLDEAREQDFEEFYEGIVEAVFERNIHDPEQVKELVGKNQEDWLQLLDPEIPNIIVARLQRDPRFKMEGGKLSW